MSTPRLSDTLPRLFEVSPKSLPEPGTHWFVSDRAGYCLACGLPERNRRHVPRVA